MIQSCAPASPCGDDARQTPAARDAGFVSCDDAPPLPCLVLPQDGGASSLIFERLARIPAMTPEQAAKQRERWARGEIAIERALAELLAAEPIILRREPRFEDWPSAHTLEAL